MASMPPPYNPAPRKSNTTTIIIVVVVALVVCCIGGVGLALWGGYQGWRNVAPIMECAFNVQQIRDAMLEYAKEHEGQLPPKDNWEGAIQPYLSKVLEKDVKEARNMFRISPLPAEGPWGCKNDAGGMTGLVYNADVAGKKLDDIKDKSSTPLLFEVPASGRNLVQPYAKQPKSTSPTVFGDHRGWAVAPVEGGIRLGNETINMSGSSGSGVRIETKSGE